MGNFVSSRALTDRDANSVNNPSTMPTSADVQKFADGLDVRLQNALENYSRKFC